MTMQLFEQKKGINRRSRSRAPYRVAAQVAFAMMAWLLALPALVSSAQEVSTRWEQPVVLFDVAQTAKVFNPLVVEDTEGRIKILWETTTATAAQPGDWANGIYCIDGDGSDWSAAVDVIAAPDGGRTFWPQHAMDAYGRLHLVWLGTNARLYYSRAPSAQACDARSWETTALPISDQVLHGDIVVDADDILHVAYAARAKDVYYMRSLDDGLSWTEPVAVSSVQPMVATAFPSLAIDLEERVHIVWEQNQLPDGVPSLGLFYAWSQDDGQTWSSAVLFSEVEGEYTEPVVAALDNGTVHLLWNGRIFTRGRYHQWSIGGDPAWGSINEFVPKNMGGGQTGPPGFATDSAGRLHVVTGTDETTYAAWSGQNWSPAYDIASFQVFGNMEHQNIAIAQGNVLYVVANAALQQIILIRGQTDAPEIAPDFESLPTGPLQPLSPPATATPQATPAPALAAVTLPSQSASPPSDGGSLTPILLSSALAFLIVAVVVVVNIGRRRS
jgi:hypothetical protein